MKKGMLVMLLMGLFGLRGIFAQSGSGIDGTASIISLQTVNQYAAVSQITSSPTGTAIQVSHTTPFTAGRRALLIQMTGTHAGNWQWVFMLAVNSSFNTITVSPLSITFSPAAGAVQLISVPEFQTLEILPGGELSCTPFNGTTGGVLAFMVKEAFTIYQGGICHADGKGFQGVSAGFGGFGGAGGIGGLPAQPGGASGTVANTGVGGGGDGGWMGITGNSGTAASFPICPGCAAPAVNQSLLTGKLMMGGAGRSGNGGNGGAGAGGGGGGSNGLPGANGGTGGNGGNGGAGGPGGGVIIMAAAQLNLIGTGPFFSALGMPGSSGQQAGTAGSGGNGGLGGGGNNCASGGGGGGGRGANGGNGGNGGSGGAAGTVFIQAPAAYTSQLQASHFTLNGGNAGSGGFGSAGGAGGLNAGSIGGWYCASSGAGSGGPTSGTAQPSMMPAPGDSCNLQLALDVLNQMGAAGNNSGTVSQSNGIFTYVSGTDTVYVQQIGNNQVMVISVTGGARYYAQLYSVSPGVSPLSAVQNVFLNGNPFYNSNTLTDSSRTHQAVCDLRNIAPPGDPGSNGSDGLPGGGGFWGFGDIQDCNSSTVSFTYTVTDFACVPGSIDLVQSGGNGSLTYLVSFLTAEEGEALNGMNYGNAYPGDYLVTAIDADGCSFAQQLSVFDMSPFSPIFSNQYTPVSCNGYADGTIDVFADPNSTGFTAYNNTISLYDNQFNVVFNDNGPGPWNISGLSAGQYFLYIEPGSCNPIQDAYQDYITISEPNTLQVFETVVQPVCGSPLGSISLMAFGGSPSYQYTWSNNSNLANLTGLAPGAYQVTVTDANQCTVTESYTLNQAVGSGPEICNNFIDDDCDGNIDNCCPLNLTVLGDTTLCYEEVGEYAVVLPGFTIDSIVWTDPNGGSSNDLVYYNSGEGLYTVEVFTTNGCHITGSFQVTLAAPILWQVAGNHLCDGQTTGNFDVTITSGTAPFTFDWTNNNTNVTDQQEDHFNVPADQSFSGNITDGNGCSTPASLYFDQGSPIVVEASNYILSCGQTSGVIQVNASGGIAPYTGTGGQIFSLGTHTVTVTDDYGCPGSTTFTVEDRCSCNPPLPVVSISGRTEYCEGQTINLTASFVSNVTYTWTDPAGNVIGTGRRISILGATTANSGTYRVTISRDSCTNFALAPITVYVNPVLSASNTGPVCPGGTVTLQASPVISGVQYQWIKDHVVIANTPTVNGVVVDVNTMGTYLVTATSGPGCRSRAVTQVRPYLPYSIVAVSRPHPTFFTFMLKVEPIAYCNAGTVSWTGPNGFNSSLCSQQIPAIPANNGLYEATLITANGCTLTASTTVNFRMDGSEIVPLALQVFPNPASDFLEVYTEGADLKAVQITELSGKMVYQTEKNFDQIDLRNLATGWYLIKAETSQGPMMSRIAITR